MLKASRQGRAVLCGCAPEQLEQAANLYYDLMTDPSGQQKTQTPQAAGSPFGLPAACAVCLRFFPAQPQRAAAVRAAS